MLDDSRVAMADVTWSHQVVRGIGQFLALKDTWDHLWALSKGPGRTFLRHDWIRNWLQFRSNHTPLIGLIYRDRQLVAIVPLCERVDRGVWKTVAFLGRQDADYHGIIVDSRVEDDAVYRYVKGVVEGLRRGQSVVRMEEAISGHPLHRTFSHWETAQRQRCPYIDTSQSWPDYHRRICDQDVRRKTRKAEALGPLHYGVVKTPDQIDPFLDEFFNAHQRRWDQTATPSRFHQDNDRRFCRQVAHDLFPSGSMHLAYLTIAGQRVAYFYGFREEERLCMYLLAFDPDFARVSIGKVFLYQLICQEYGRYRIIDLLRGSEPYKDHWATDVAINESLVAYRSRLHRTLFTLYDKWGRK